MNDVLSLSKRLEQCARYLEATGLKLMLQWAADIKAIIIPPPGELETEKQMQCKNCGRVIKASSEVNFEIIKIDCVCGARTENENN